MARIATGRLLTFLGWCSCVLNWLTGGEWPQTLCARIAHRWGANCVFCKLVGLILRDPEHCRDQLRKWVAAHR